MLFHRGTTPQDKARGALYVMEAAQRGDAKAQYQAGLIHEFGAAQYPQRDDHAVTWYARAGESGHVLAAARLAKAYRKGELGLPKDAESMFYWQQLVDSLSADAEIQGFSDAETRH